MLLPTPTPPLPPSVAARVLSAQLIWSIVTLFGGSFGVCWGPSLNDVRKILLIFYFVPLPLVGISHLALFCPLTLFGPTPLPPSMQTSYLDGPSGKRHWGNEGTNELLEVAFLPAYLVGWRCQGDFDAC